MSARVSNYQPYLNNSRSFGYEECKAISKSIDENKNNRIDKNEAYFTDGTLRKVDSNYYETNKPVIGTNDMANAIYENKISIQYLKPEAAWKIANFFDDNKDGIISKNELNLKSATYAADANGGGKVTTKELAQGLIDGTLIINGNHVATNYSSSSGISSSDITNAAIALGGALAIVVGTAVEATQGQSYETHTSYNNYDNYYNCDITSHSQEILAAGNQKFESDIVDSLKNIILNNKLSTYDQKLLIDVAFNNIKKFESNLVSVLKSLIESNQMNNETREYMFYKINSHNFKFSSSKKEILDSMNKR